MAGQPKAEHPIDEALVRELLAEQHADLAGLPIAPLAEGWDNILFRLGAHLVVRLPKRAVGGELILTEQRHLPEVAAGLPVPVPTPVRVGRPGGGYPWSWSITPWLPGEPAARAPLRPDQGPRLGAFLKALHRPAPAGAPHNLHRSVPLAARAALTEPGLARLAAARPQLVTPAIRRAWEDGAAAEIDLPAGWIHGDLHARNLLCDAGALSGVIDWGDMARGDPATDFYGLWMLAPDPEARRAAIAAYGGLSPATLQRARGWAVSLAVVMIEAGLVNDPELAALGEQTLRALADEP